MILVSGIILGIVMIVTVPDHAVITTDPPKTKIIYDMVFDPELGRYKQVPIGVVKNEQKGEIR